MYRFLTFTGDSLVNNFFAPGIWICGRLSFSQKYLLVGFIMMIALTSLSLPLLFHADENSRIAFEERKGLKLFISQSDMLMELIMFRNQSISELTVRPTKELQERIENFIDVARQNKLKKPAERLRTVWMEIQNPKIGHDSRSRFAQFTNAINTLLTIIRDSARMHRMNIDQNLDAAFEMLTNRLPVILATLGNQQVTLAFNTLGLEPFELGAQAGLTESVTSLWAGVDQLIENRPNTLYLKGSLESLISGIARQQETADKFFAEPNSIFELQRLASANLEQARKLLYASAAEADGYLITSISRFHHARLIIASLLFGATAAISYLFASIYFSTLRSLKSLSEGTAAFCLGQLDSRITLDTQDELVLVARNFNTVATKFEHLLDVIREQNESRQRELETLVHARTAQLIEINAQLSAAGQKMQDELNVARFMQTAILPQEFPNQPDYSIHANMFAARELGGDFYDCFPFPDGRFGIVIADVSGKGVVAAFFMAVSRTVLLDQAVGGKSPAEVLASANNLLCERNPMDMFVTACYGIYQPRDGNFVYANAGHHPSLIRKTTGLVEVMPYSCDLALGVMAGATYINYTATLNRGDALLLYTDGVPEALSASGEPFGDEKLRSWFSKTVPEDNAATLVGNLVKEVESFVDGAEASDDLTCLILCRKKERSAIDENPVHVSDKRQLLDYKLPSALAEIAKLADVVENTLHDWPDLIFPVNLCLEELITNIIQHGLNGDCNRFISVKINISEDWLEIVLKDDAPPFDPFTEAPAPNLDVDLDNRFVGGLGIHIVKSMMDNTKAYYDGGNLIILFKTLKKRVKLWKS